MKIRRWFVLLLPLALVLGACSSPTSSRYQDPGDDDSPPSENQVILPADSIG